MNDGVERLPDQFLFGIAQHVTGTRIDEGHPPGPVEAIHALGDRHQDAAEPLRRLDRLARTIPADRAVGIEQDGDKNEAERHCHGEDAQYGAGAIDTGQGLAKLDLGYRPDFAGRIPGPGPHHRNPQRIAIAGQI